MNLRRYCPVCWKPVSRTRTSSLVAEHFDSIGRDVCPFSGAPFIAAGYGRRNRTHDREYVRPAPVEHPPESAGVVARLERMESLVNA